MESLLILTPPNQLDFNVTGGVQSQVVLELRNPSETKHVAFKIKTTAPKNYFVKPSSGVVPPDSKCDVNIVLVPLFEPPREPIQDRFLIQSTVVDSGRTLAKEEWAALNQSREALDEKRLSVTFTWCGFGPNANRSELPSEALHGFQNQSQDPSELKKQYSDLLAYAVGLEKQKKEIEAELYDLKRNQRGNRPRATGIQGNPGLEYWQVGILVLGVVCALKIVKFL